MTTATAPPDLNHAAADLIAALTDLEAMEGFRGGLHRTTAFTEAALEAMPVEAPQALAVWRALDTLCAAVEQRKDQS